MTQEAGNQNKEDKVELIPVDQMEKMSHSDLYMARMKAKTKEEQDHIAPYEHRAFAREWTQERPLIGPLSLAVAIPAYTAVKAVGGTDSRSGASLKQVSEGYKGVGEGVVANIKKPWEMVWNRGTEKAVTEPLKKPSKEAVEPWKMQWGGKVSTSKNKSSIGFDMSTYLSTLEGVESGGNPTAKAPTSSATGLHQFTSSTWMSWVNKLGLDYTLSDRTDPEKSRKVAEEFTKANYQSAKETLGREPTKTEVYMYHLLGDASKFISAPRESSVTEYVGKKALKANKGLFYNSDGTAKTVGQVMEFFGKKFENAEKRN